MRCIIGQNKVDLILVFGIHKVSPLDVGKQTNPGHFASSIKFWNFLLIRN